MKVLEACKMYEGVPYVWGGDSSYEGGFDCSGFIYNVLSNVGLPVPRTTAQGYFNLFKSTAFTNCDLRSEGALLFFGKSVNTITHIAICCGDGVHMWESIGSSKNTRKNTGKGVTYSKISRRKDLVAIRLPNYPNSNGLIVPQPTLRRGSKNDRVKQLQKCLNVVIGSKLVIDGSFGANTKKALEIFQTINRLVCDGIYGAKSYNKLLEVVRGL